MEDFVERRESLVVELAVSVAGTTHEVRVRAEPGATLGAVVEAIEPGASRLPVHVDGRARTVSLPATAAGLVTGAHLVLGRPAADAAAGPAAVATLAVAAGVRAGATVPLRPGTWMMGTAPGCDVAVHDSAASSHHALVHVDRFGAVEIEDVSPAHPTCLDGRPITRRTAAPVGTLVRVGDHLAVVGAAPEPDGAPATGSPTTGFNRPPRPGAVEAPPPVAVPQASDRSWGAHRTGLVSGLVLVVGGLGAYVVMRSPLTLVFAAMGALTTLVSGWEGRRADRRRRRGDDRRSTQERARLRRELEAQVLGARQARWRAHPHLAEVVRRASAGSSRLWERRADDTDASCVAVGIGTVPWLPVVVGGGAERDPLVQAELDAAGSLVGVPVTLHLGGQLGGGRSVGVVGDPSAALAVARALVLQAVVLHGPADLAVVVAGEPAWWGWAKWLPHARDRRGGPRPLVAATVDELDALIAELPRAPDPRDADGPAAAGAGPSVLLVLDESIAAAPPSGARRDVLAGRYGPASLLVVARTARTLPSRCDTVVTVAADGRARVVCREGEVLADVLAAGCDLALARTTARALARWHDPELSSEGAGLPAAVGLLELLGPGAEDPTVVAQRWSSAGPDPAARAPIALAADGVLELDLVRDGPHGLIAGTTGSGKSELLRTIVAALASHCSPQHLTFVFVDYKGGSAFDRCAALPHAVGLVTDLDGHLGERALRSLDAELGHRERVLRAAGAADLTSYRRLVGVAPLPRLVVAIDEFATLAAELPDFLDALVGIAQRGRSLGVHLLLATQRPSGAVSENIRANTNLRIALRVQDSADSTDVVGSPAAAHLPRSRPGRMLVRFGPSELVQAQSASTGAAARRRSRRSVDVEPFVAAEGSVVQESVGDDEQPSDLDRLVGSVSAAAAGLGLAAPRRPWLDPLPSQVPLAALPAGCVALADEPEHQAQPAWAWRPNEGLVLYGITGSGTTTALAALALALATSCSPVAHHLYVLDMGNGQLGPLAGLAHVGAVVGATEHERRWRLVRTLRAQLDRRRATGGGTPITLLLDGYGALAAEHADLHGGRLLDDLARIVTEGPEVGITTVIAAERPGAVPFSLATTIATKWLFRLADAGDYATFGVRAGCLPTFCPGRAVVADSGTEIQLADPGPLEAAVAAVNRQWPQGPGAPPIATLPDRVAAGSLGVGRACAYPWRIPVGIADSDLEPAWLVLHEGDHALVAGPARSGRSTALHTLAAGVALARPDAYLVVVTPRRSPLSAMPGATVVDEVDLLTAIEDAPQGHPLVVIVDDAELVTDPRSTLGQALARPDRAVHVLAAGRTDALRLAYGHWTGVVRRSRTGVLLRPDPDLDADLLATALPRHSPVRPAPGRGYLVIDGAAELVQFATTDVVPTGNRGR